MSPTYRIVSKIHSVLVNPRTLEPRRGVFIILYYGIGAFATFIVVAMILLGLEAYGLRFARDFLYARLGEPVLKALESLLF